MEKKFKEGNERGKKRMKEVNRRKYSKRSKKKKMKAVSPFFLVCRPENGTRK